VDGVTPKSAQAGELTPSSPTDGVSGSTPNRESDSVSRPLYRKRTESKTTGSLAGRLALSRTEAAAAIGMSVDSFERYVQPELKIVRVGRMRLIQVRELERWLQENAAHILEASP
jgi:hypothetical protein